MLINGFFGYGYSYFISQHKCSLLDGYCLVVRILISIAKIINPWWVAYLKTQQEENQEKEEADLCFPPLFVLGLSRYNLGVNVGRDALTLIPINLVHQLWQTFCTNFELS